MCFERGWGEFPLEPGVRGRACVMVLPLPSAKKMAFSPITEYFINIVKIHTLNIHTEQPVFMNMRTHKPHTSHPQRCTHKHTRTSHSQTRTHTPQTNMSLHHTQPSIPTFSNVHTNHTPTPFHTQTSKHTTTHTLHCTAHTPKHVYTPTSYIHKQEI